MNYNGHFNVMKEILKENFKKVENSFFIFFMLYIFNLWFQQLLLKEDSEDDNFLLHFQTERKFFLKKKRYTNVFFFEYLLASKLPYVLFNLNEQSIISFLTSSLNFCCLQTLLLFFCCLEKFQEVFEKVRWNYDLTWYEQ
jgi:hypothetical protein